ncbi:MAG: PD-(D/E)XK nuclease family protein [Oscillospiraceae bacterium]|jgi:ATP-dependent helicase/nuclease subunit B|nr:PD-(D/E)XK nuclease family protein [Oscillospiraceae bacterium]
MGKRLTLLLGRAGTGKTSRVMNEIKDRGERGETGLLLLVPEQFSHDAERQLCRVCGDALSLYGEVVTFTGLCSKVFAETGAAGEFPDESALILTMWRALESVRPMLRAYAQNDRGTDFLERLKAAAGEFKSAGIAPEALEAAAASASVALGEKLGDLALVIGAYNGLLGANGDAPDRLAALAKRIPQCGSLANGHVYVDGFNDFTALELDVVGALLAKCGGMTVCLTCGDLLGDEAVFETPRVTASRLTRIGEDAGARCETARLSPAEGEARSPALRYMEGRLFLPRGGGRFAGDAAAAVALYGGLEPYEECEMAAAETLRLVRSGYRWRDIAVVSRDEREYTQLCESVFERYGVPVFTGGRTDILQRPPAALIVAALEIASGEWDCTRIFRYLKTGLTGLSTEDCCILENYAVKWDIKGGRNMWTRGEPWTLPVSGFGRESAGGDEALKRVDGIRRRVAAPLEELRASLERAPECDGKLGALIAFLERIDLPGRLPKKAEEFTRRGDLRLASEYARIWEIIKRVCEQFARILGEFKTDAAEFARLFTLAISRCDVGAIPVSLDRVMLGGMDKCRRRNIKCLIVLGAADGSIPRVSETGGILSGSERDELAALGLDTYDTARAGIVREINMIYSSLTLPSRRLVMTYPTANGGLPSSVVTELADMFDLPARESGADSRLAEAVGPCFELAAMSASMPAGAMAAAARAYFSEMPEYAPMLNAGESAEEKLSGECVRLLYGREPRLSASRVDRFNTCNFAFFMESGLRAAPRRRAELDAAAAGTFLHYILEKTARDIMESGGFYNVGEDVCAELVARYAEEYAARELRNFRDKPGRFRYMYGRLVTEAERIVADTADEMRRSKFRPLEFEYKFSGLVNKNGASFYLSGLIDRVDVWETGGRRYVRVIDYKTGGKEFDLSDVRHGLNAQMLIYLSALRGWDGPAADAIPAGVLYVPAKDVALPADRNVSDGELRRLRTEKLKRSGVLLNDPDVLLAMECGERNVYLPVKRGDDGSFTGESLVTAPEMDKLLEYADAVLERAAADIMDGRMAPDPYAKGGRQNVCEFCDYRAACYFDLRDGGGEKYPERLDVGEFPKPAGFNA